MDGFIELFNEMEKEYPSLARLYDDFMAGEFEEEHLRRSYARNFGLKEKIDQAKEKYLIIFQDMGLFQSEQA